MRLDQHLCDPRRPAEIAVDLKRRMVVEEVRQRRLHEQQPQILVRRVAIVQSRHEVDQPRAAPSGVSATVGESEVERFPSGGQKLGGGLVIELGARM